jgi:hypothetical protein
MSQLPLQGVISVFSLDLEEDDEQYWLMLELWAAMIGVQDQLKLISRTEIEVDGLPAIKRLYEKPLVDSSTNEFTGIEYNYHVLVIKDQTHYYLNMRTTNPDEFEQYQPVADQILTTVVFLE